MFKVILIMGVGVVAGRLLHKHSIKGIGTAIEIVIVLLLLLMGISVGSNAMIMDNIASIGVDALLITLGALGGSIFVSMLIFRTFYKSKQ